MLIFPDGFLFTSQAVIIAVPVSCDSAFLQYVTAFSGLVGIIVPVNECCFLCTGSKRPVVVAESIDPLLCLGGAQASGPVFFPQCVKLPEKRLQLAGVIRR